MRLHQLVKAFAVPLKADVVIHRHMTQDARKRGYKPGRFSFNVRGGRCEACGGDGQIRVEMHFLPDVYVTCDVCKGKRYNHETLEVRYKGLNIAEVLDLTVHQARQLFESYPSLERRLAVLEEVGLEYLRLGQPATTLSGGEAQRIKISRELGKRSLPGTMLIKFFKRVVPGQFKKSLGNDAPLGCGVQPFAVHKIQKFRQAGVILLRCHMDAHPWLNKCAIGKNDGARRACNRNHECLLSPKKQQKAMSEAHSDSA